VKVCADVERALVATLLDERVDGHYRRPSEPGRWPAIRTRLGDPQTWKDLGYVIGQLPVGILTFTVVVTLVTLPLALVAGPIAVLISDEPVDIGPWNVDTLWPALLIAVLAIPLGWLAVKAIDLLGRGQAAWARLLLFSEPDPALTAQVVDAKSAQARIVEAADAERRRLERDLHDGAQQRLVSLSLKLAMAKSKVGEDAEARALLDEAHEESRAAVSELRDLARGIHPAILTDRGLAPALEEVASRATVPTEVTVEPERRFASAVEATAYFVVSEALTNVGKYAEASQAAVHVVERDGRLLVEVRDDGVGGADPAAGSGLRGLADRVGALGGALEVDSPPGWGTRVRAAVPAAATPAG
jgi:signal transduction histidine kinase